MKELWKVLKEQSKLYLPAAVAALIGYVIAKVRQTTKKIETVPIQKKTPTPGPSRSKRRRH